MGLFLLLLTAGGLLVGYFAETVIARGFPSCALCAVLLLRARTQAAGAYGDARASFGAAAAALRALLEEIGRPESR